MHEKYLSGYAWMHNNEAVCYLFSILNIKYSDHRFMNYHELWTIVHILNRVFVGMD